MLIFSGFILTIMQPNRHILAVSGPQRPLASFSGACGPVSPNNLHPGWLFVRKGYRNFSFLVAMEKCAPRKGKFWSRRREGKVVLRPM